MTLQIGVVFPQIEFPSDPTAVRDYTQTAEELGYSHILAYDHILGANPDRPGGWKGPYTYQDPFLEPFVLFSFMAGMTKRIAFASGIIILPQRETAVVAKQAATLDVLSNGRFRLGVGIGWNKVEYVALNQDFHTRGKRIEEQIEVMQQLWHEELITYNGRWHHIPDAGLNPLPLNKHVPLWFGGHADAVLQRAAKWGDGWFPNYRQPNQAKPEIEKLMGYAESNGRSPQEIGIEARITYGDGNPDQWHDLVAGWQAVGATHITLNTMSCGFDTPAKHIAAIRHFASEILS